MKMPATILKHAGVDKVVSGEEQGSDRKYWVFFNDGYGFYEHGQREDYFWISHGTGLDSVAEFKGLCLEKK